MSCRRAWHRRPALLTGSAGLLSGPNLSWSKNVTDRVCAQVDKICRSNLGSACDDHSFHKQGSPLRQTQGSLHGDHAAALESVMAASIMELTCLTAKSLSLNAQISAVLAPQSS
jgi:hypothetical protein